MTSLSVGFGKLYLSYNITYTPLCHTSPLRSELELQAFGRDQLIIKGSFSSKSAQKLMVSLPLIMLIVDRWLKLSCIEISLTLPFMPGRVSRTEHGKIMELLEILEMAGSP
jgi:hypothetical protein